MSNILIRDVPAEVHEKLQVRAERNGQSLQQYLTAQLQRLAERPTMDEILDRIETRGGSEIALEETVAHISEGRDER